MSVKLCSLNELKSYLRISASEAAYDAILTSVIYSASAECERFTGRKFTKATYASEKHFGGGQSACVKNWPIDSTATVTVQNYDALALNLWTVSSINYDIDYDAGIVRLVGNLAFSNNAGAAVISYTGGYATTGIDDDAKVGVPDDLSFSVLEYAAAKFKKQQGAIDEKALSLARETAEAAWASFSGDY
jgi:uncharacterized phiE125 gp8 family phage protein